MDVLTKNIQTPADINGTQSADQVDPKVKKLADQWLFLMKFDAQQLLGDVFSVIYYQQIFDIDQIKLIRKLPTTKTSKCLDNAPKMQNKASVPVSDSKNI
uniref:Uncharacterized protein n=1 Tax=Romanomermis culicivorax TaxID=13658 RepID=A0A915I6G3_ROMCU